VKGEKINGKKKTKQRFFLDKSKIGVVFKVSIA
jgi:hypothetical protein